MTVGELIEKLAEMPRNAEVALVMEGDRTVGIWEECYTLTGNVGSDMHRYVEDGTGVCMECAFIKSAHDSAPVVVYLQGVE